MQPTKISTVLTPQMKIDFLKLPDLLPQKIENLDFNEKIVDFFAKSNIELNNLKNDLIKHDDMSERLNKVYELTKKNEDILLDSSKSYINKNRRNIKNRYQA